MDRLLHDALDGEHRRDDLSPAERAQLESLETMIATVTRPLRMASAPDLSGRVLARIAQTQGQRPLWERLSGSLQRGLDWLWTPRPLRVRPAYALATLTVLVIFAVATSTPVSPAAPERTVASVEATPATLVYVQFRLDGREATRVALAGSFSGWRPEYELRESEPGSWSILVPLQPGVHDYAFVVDGQEWVPDPHAFQIQDGFGGMNSRIALPSPANELVQS
jgi:hypothetical protein